MDVTCHISRFDYLVYITTFPTKPDAQPTSLIGGSPTDNSIGSISVCGTSRISNGMSLALRSTKSMFLPHGTSLASLIDANTLVPPFMSQLTGITHCCCQVSKTQIQSAKGTNRALIRSRKFKPNLAQLKIEAERIDRPSPIPAPKDCTTNAVESKQPATKPSTETADSKPPATAETAGSKPPATTETADSKKPATKPSSETPESKKPATKPSTETPESKQPATKPSTDTAEPEPNSAKTSTSTESKLYNNFTSITQWRGFSVLKKGVVIPTHSLTPLIPKFTRRKSKRIREDTIPQLSPALDTEAFNFKSSWKNFSLSELQEATDNYSRENLIGQGGYAEVYKGKLKSGKFVAIKKLTRGSPEEMTMDFLSELGIIVHVDHPNIAKMIGYGVEGGITLFFNCLLMEAWLLYFMISDFGLAKWLPDQWTHHTVSKVEGTFGYLPPEFFMYGIVNEKTDVFAYGVLLLELITGRQAIDSSQQSLVMWAKPLIKENKIKELVDPSLGDGYELDQLNVVLAISSICIHQSAVVSILNGDRNSLEGLKEGEHSVLKRTYSEEMDDAEEYNSTKYLSDINRQLEILLDCSKDTL
ncbi:receptor-like cytosolic serine/threonine-protein kinase RBK2 isoform X1 [Gossypium australe]|uniref:Receptor-like cytosolic serine/threonine-protein kinase RBK2 isoform X1 n=1 Tax=Gossypium australe TaxID=47621 RepID=A0A5B6UHX3_9ROSI|nr:receptor-like cytosolic serine/threonine-protein kinase RBK2 isoform X1 [Gossypium australe]